MKTGKNVVYYNFVCDQDLFYTMYDFLRFSLSQKWTRKVASTDDFYLLTLQEAKELGTAAVDWLERKQLPKIYTITMNDNAPASDTWGSLYYQTLAYMDRVYPKYKFHPMRQMSLLELQTVCNECIMDLRKLIEEMREPTDDDI